ncbi:keratin, type I cytoskeletal 19-like [Rhinoderma darwinii]|uniref:keratin, type I cytoskeletal 19-like n=1 Tax=Rhinoderma darwinii TaxID=43563 RepID=UPI003F663F59
MTLVNLRDICMLRSRKYDLRSIYASYKREASKRGVSSLNVQVIAFSILPSAYSSGDIMGYRIALPSFRTKAGGEYISYPKYRTHHSLECDHHLNRPRKINVLQNGSHYSVHNPPGTFRELNSKCSGYGRPMETKYGVYRCHMSSFRDYTAPKNNHLLSFNEKKTMQSLNGRLTSYLENVKSMEEENVLLEKKICDWYEENEGLIFPDCSQYLNVITDLQNQVFSASEQNAILRQEIVDGQMTADGYRKKYEMELRIRNTAEEDLGNHYGILENINMESQDLDLHIQYLEEEFLQVKETSEEELTCLQAQLGTRVNVEVETAPSIDLNAALSQIRNEYETLMERNLIDVEKMYHEVISELSQEVSFGMEQLQLSNNEVTEIKLCVHTLETELNKQLSMITSLKCTLVEIHDHYGSYLSHLQGLINMNEAHLEDIQSKLKQLNYEYNVYMDVKTSLEKEIVTYKYLLEGHDSSNSPWEMTEGKSQFWCERDEDTSELIPYELRC